MESKKVALIGASGFVGAHILQELLNRGAGAGMDFPEPAIEMSPAHPGKRTGAYRTSLDTPVFDENKRSRLSVEDTAVAIVDELEQPKHIRRRFTAAY